MGASDHPGTLAGLRPRRWEGRGRRALGTPGPEEAVPTVSHARWCILSIKKLKHRESSCLFAAKEEHLTHRPPHRVAPHSLGDGSVEQRKETRQGCSVRKRNRPSGNPAFQVVTASLSKAHPESPAINLRSNHSQQA